MRILYWLRVVLVPKLTEGGSDTVVQPRANVSTSAHNPYFTKALLQAAISLYLKTFSSAGTDRKRESNH